MFNHKDITCAWPSLKSLAIHDHLQCIIITLIHFPLGYGLEFMLYAHEIVLNLQVLF